MKRGYSKQQEGANNANTDQILKVDNATEVGRLLHDVCNLVAVQQTGVLVGVGDGSGEQFWKKLNAG